MPVCYVPGLAILAALFGVGIVLDFVVPAVTAAFDAVVTVTEQALAIGAVAARLTLLAMALTVAVEFAAWSARVVRRYQARRMAATGQPCAQAGTCPVDCAVKQTAGPAEPGGRRLLPVTAVERPSAGDFTPAA